jgi:hypothetical protein
MKQLTAIILAGITVTGLFSCRKTLVGIGPSISQERTVAYFNAIDLRMYGDVYYTNDTVRKVEIVAPRNILAMLETTVIDSRLVIRFAGESDQYTGDQVRINVSAPGVTGLGLNASGSIYCMNTMAPENLYLRINGSGNISMRNVIAKRVDVINSGSGSITALYGSVNDAEIKVTGSGQVNLSGLLINGCDAHLSGSARIHVKVANRLDVNIPGSGTVYFSGYPYVTSHISGTGHLVHL